MSVLAEVTAAMASSGCSQLPFRLLGLGQLLTAAMRLQT